MQLDSRAETTLSKVVSLFKNYLNYTASSFKNHIEVHQLKTQLPSCGNEGQVL